MAALTRARGDWLVKPAAASAVRVPTLGVVGSLDPIRAAMQELKRLRPDMMLVVVEGATHASSNDPRGILRRPEFLVLSGRSLQIMQVPPPNNSV